MTIVQFLSYLFRICTPDDGSLEPKHVAPCLLLPKIKYLTFYFISCVLDG